MTILIGDVRKTLRKVPAGSVHMAVTSPPYWSLRSYLPKDHKHKKLEIGSERTMSEHIDVMVDVCAEVRRCLRDDGTLWLNYGDVYATQGGTEDKRGSSDNGGVGRAESPRHRISDLDQGNLCGLPWRIAFALQDAGWILRSAIVWAKGCSFRPEWSGSVMPESVQGVRWERCRVKVKPQGKGTQASTNGNSKRTRDMSNGAYLDSAVWCDCPGCHKCKASDGYVLRRGSWRPTSAYEMLFLFAKTADYYCDGEAVKEAAAWPDAEGIPFGGVKHLDNGNPTYSGNNYVASGTRNLRNVWAIGTSPSDVPHYATFPEDLVEPCIKAGTSDKGVCPHCGDPWARIIDKRQVKRERPNDRTATHKASDNGNGAVNSCGNTVAGVDSRTIGWRPTCDCHAHEPIPATVLDPFGGSGTSAIVARKLGRDFIICELNETYAAIARERIDAYAPLFGGQSA